MRGCFAVLLGLGLFGCVSTTHTGKDFDEKAVQAIPNGTSQVEVEQKFGKPGMTRMEADGSEVWIYNYTTVKLAYAPYYVGDPQMTQKTAEVRFRGGKVTRVSTPVSPSSPGTGAPPPSGTPAR